MNKSIKPVVVLTAICAVAAVLLAVMNTITSPAIKAYEEASANAAFEEVALSYKVGNSVSVENDSYVKSYRELYDGSKLSGYVLEIASSGYGGPLTLAASYNLDGIVLSAKLVSDSETPGVGKKAENEGYMDKFKGTGSISNPVPVSKNMLSEEDSAAVSGASMTFRGVSKAIEMGSEFVKKIGGR